MSCIQNEEDSEGNEDDSHTTNFVKFFKKSSMCFTDHRPPIFARQDEACNGSKIIILNAKEVSEKLQLAYNETIEMLTKNHTKTQENLKAGINSFNYSRVKKLLCCLQSNFC